MNEELNCLGQTPEVAAQFDEMCEQHDRDVIEFFKRKLYDLCEEAISHGFPSLELCESLEELARIRRTLAMRGNGY